MPKKTANVDTTIRQFQTFLPCRLTEDELLERGSELAHARERAEQFAADAAKQRKELKEAESRLDNEVSRLARIVRERQEQRATVVVVRMAKKAGYVDEVRIDTGEVIATRRMADGEAQTELLTMPPDAIPAPGELEA